MNIQRTRGLAGVGFLVSLLLSAAPVAAGEPSTPQRIGLEEFIHRGAMAASTDATAHAAIEAAKDSMAVVFVPGILGSRLTRRGKVEGFLYRALFGDVRAAAFTFPSVFELLPPVPVDPADIDASCVEVPLGPEAADRIPGNYFSADFWRTDFGRHLLGTPWEDLGIPAAEFFQRLEAVLKAAGEIRGSLNLNDLRVPVTFFYAADHRTVLKALVRRVGGGGFRVEFPFDGPGDGRVPSASAKNEGFAQGARDFRRLRLSHGDLPRDPRFITYVGQELGRIISA